MQYKIVETENEFLGLRDTWENFYNIVEKKNIFQSFIWNYNWYKTSYAELSPYIIIFYNQDNSVLAIFPLLIDKNKTLRFISDIHSDFSTFLINSNKVIVINSVFKEFSLIVNNEMKIKSIELKNLNQEINYLGELIFHFDYKKIIYQSNAYSYVDIDASKELFSCFSDFTSKQKNKLKRNYKKNEHYKSIIYGCEKEFPISKIIKIKDSMIKSKLRDKNFLDNNLLRIIKFLFENNNLIIHEIYDENEVVDIKFIINEMHEYILWISIYENINSIHIFSYFRFIEDMRNKEGFKVKRINFGRGIYPYKVEKFQPYKKAQFSFFYTKDYSRLLIYLVKFSTKYFIINFYKKNKKLINKILRK